MSVIYKTLFEVKVMHEYFLTRKDGSVIFEKPDQPSRLDFLLNEFIEGKRSINEYINFEFPESLKSIYAGLFLKILPAYSGCKIVVRVNARTLADQSVVYEPFVPLTNDLNIFILLSRKDSAIDTFTNARIIRSCPSIYFFSNIDAVTPRSFPFLTGSIPVQDTSFAYEQGELSLSGIKIQEYYRQGGVDTWNDVAGSGFSNEADRLLLPEKFNYTFDDTTNLTNAIFVLKDSNGNEAANITTTDADGIGRKFPLNFSGKVKTIPSVAPSPLTEFLYTLEATGNNGYSRSHNIFFSNDVTAANPWAVLNIGTTADNSDFNLFANDGFIIKRKDALGVWTQAPVFEIPFKSRLAYWRFISNRGRELNVSAALADYVNKENKVLVTKRPRSLAKSWFFLRKEASNDTVYVPNPVSPELKFENDRRFFFDIRVQQSVLFPEVV